MAILTTEEAIVEATGLVAEKIIEHVGAKNEEQNAEINKLKEDLTIVEESFDFRKELGKNLLNLYDFEPGNFDQNGGEMQSNNYFRNKTAIKVIEGESYTLQGYNNDTLKIAMRRIVAYDNSGAIRYVAENLETFTVPTDFEIVAIRISIPAFYCTENQKPMLSKGSDIVKYEPYNTTEYANCPFKLSNALEYDDFTRTKTEVGKNIYDFRLVDHICSDYVCRTSFVQNPGRDTVDRIYDLYKDLVKRFPEYVTRTYVDKIGTSTEYKIDRYDFSPVKPQNSTMSDVCKIIYLTGTHGGEWPNILAAYRFFKDLCENWRNDKLLAAIRFNCHITVVPIVNPYGFVSGHRKNENGVDLNRNFTKGWHIVTEDTTSINYQGTSPASEKSTQAIERMCSEEHFDFGIDHHIYDSFSNSDKFGYFVNCSKRPEDVSFGNMYGVWANQKCMKENTHITDFTKSYFQTVTQSDFDGYAYGAFKHGMLWESMTEWGNEEMESDVDSQKFNAECLGALIYTAMRHYHKY